MCRGGLITRPYNAINPFFCHIERNQIASKPYFFNFYLVNSKIIHIFVSPILTCQLFRMKEKLRILSFLAILFATKICVAQESEFFTVRGVPFEMVFVEGGSFMMGCDTLIENCPKDELPMHEVTLSNFYIGKIQVTQLLWRTVMGSNPSKLAGDHLPVNMVSWSDCQIFIKRLNELTGRQFSLPTEAQWEYAARGGNKSKNYKYSGGNTLDNIAWYSQNSGKRPRRGADKAPNELGIHDMTGNVWEWCNDWYSPNYYNFSADEDPSGFAVGTERVFRGGSYRNSPQLSRVTYRNYQKPDRRYSDLGFRLVLNP